MTAREIAGAPAIRRSRRRQPGGGALFVIALLLGAAGLIRLGLGATLAIASTGSDAPEPPAAAEICEPDAGAFAMIEELNAREEVLARREAEIADRAQALALARAELDKKLADLVAAEGALSKTLTLADEAADADVARLVALYEKMKPKDAAAVFAEMDPEFAAGFLGRMRTDAAAAVLAGIEPKRAYAISALLAGRNANAPKE